MLVTLNALRARLAADGGLVPAAVDRLPSPDSNGSAMSAEAASLSSVPFPKLTAKATPRPLLEDISA